MPHREDRAGGRRREDSFLRGTRQSVCLGRKILLLSDRTAILIQKNHQGSGKRLWRVIVSLTRQNSDASDRSQPPVQISRFLSTFLRSGMRVLDVGCGDGRASAALAAAVSPQGVVQGLDTNRALLTQALETYADNPNLRFICGDIVLEPPGGRYDAVIAIRSLLKIADLDRAIANMNTVLRPGGTVLALEANLAETVFTPSPPPAVQVFLDALLGWRDAMGFDNALVDHLPGLFARHGLCDIELHAAIQELTPVTPGFAEELALWEEFLNQCAPAIIAAGRLDAESCREAQRGFADWSGAALQHIHVPVHIVEGRRPFPPRPHKESGAPRYLDPAMPAGSPPPAEPVQELLASLLSDLVALPSPSPPGDTSLAAAYAARRLRQVGYSTEVLARSNQMENVVATLGSGSPNLTFLVPLDTPPLREDHPWHGDPFLPHCENGRLVGLGSASAKASAAVHLWLAEEIARRGGPAIGSVTFALVAEGHGFGNDGTGFLRQADLLHPDALVVGAPTGNRLMLAERGILWGRLTAWSHLAGPDDTPADDDFGSEADNPILRMTRLLQRLDGALTPRLAERGCDGPLKPTFTVNQINGSPSLGSTLVVPTACTAEISRRLLPREKVDIAFAELLALVEGAGEPSGSVRFEYRRGFPGFATAVEEPLVQAFLNAGLATGVPLVSAANPGESEARYFAGAGCAMLVFGPGLPPAPGAPSESVALADLGVAARIQWDVVRRLIGFAGPDTLDDSDCPGRL